MVNFINILRSRFSYESAFYLLKSLCQSQNKTREKLRKALSYKKCVHKMLMKLKPKSDSQTKTKKFCGIQIRAVVLNILEVGTTQSKMKHYLATHVVL